MKTKTIGEVAKLAGVSIRSLRHYDEIGLLRPSFREENGYRRYSEEDTQILYDILFYRALGFSLAEVKRLLETPVVDRRAQLIEQKKQLQEHIYRLQNIAAQLDVTIATEQSRGETTMSNDNNFSVFAGFDPDQYAEETKQKWGGGDAYKESARRTKNYSKEDWQRYKQESDQLNQEMARLMSEGVAANSDATLDVVERLRLQIDHWFYPCSKRMHASLGEMYIADERFSETYERIAPGLAAYIREATLANLEND